MGDQEITDAPDEKLTYGAIFDREFPYLLALGMTYQQYWYESPDIAGYYIEAHRIKAEEQNTMLWLQGNYTFAAISTALSNLHFDGKQHKVNTFMKEPYGIFTKKEDRTAKEERKIIDALNRFEKQWKSEGATDGKNS
ncbi:MAG: hypothetical protein J6S14_21980 [Clostridia bacterium]|nr:hypothetical protein [Clostridia bacterium]